MSSLSGRKPLVAALSVLALTAVPLASADDQVRSGAAPSAGLKGEYFNEMNLTAPVGDRVDPTVDFAWDDIAQVPMAGVEPNTWSARWTGTVTPRYSERYSFSTRSDDGVRVFIDDQTVISNWTEHRVATDTGEIDLQAGHAYAIRVEFYEKGGRAEIRLRWQSASQALEVIPASQLAPPAVAPEPDPAPTPAPAPAPAPPAAAPTAAPLPVPTVATPAPPVLPAPAVLASDTLPPPSTPVAGEHFNALPAGGNVLVRDGDRIIALDRGATLPVGARIDTRAGAVRIETAPAKHVKRKRQFAQLGGANFRVTQPANGERIVNLDMIHGDFESCASTTARSASRGTAHASRSDRTVRRIFGSGKGRFRTRGRDASATVRGTVWSVEDRCDSSIVRVFEGLVDAENLITGKVVPVAGGESYTVRHTR